MPTGRSGRGGHGAARRRSPRLRALLPLGVLLLGIGSAAAEVPTDLTQRLRGDMRKFVFADPPPPAALHTAFERADGTAITLHDFQGGHLLVNFWATWCAPCREEMPALNLLEEEFASERFRVLAVASGRNALDDIRRFYEDTDVTALEIFRSPDSALARDFAVLGLPMTVLLDPEGREIARLIGAADWYSDAARDLVRALLQAEHHRHR